MRGPLRFGRYQRLFRIASGGMAEVLAAGVRGHAGFEELVAVKRIVPHLADEEAFVHMFLDEARIAAQVSSPHVVRTLDVGQDEEGAPYIVMELVVGPTLSELVAAVRPGRLPLDVAIEIAAQAAEGLHDAHEARTASGAPLALVHRDVSPQNVLVDAEGRARVADFGVAQAATERLAQTRQDQRKGKYAYFSPEQSRGAPLDRRSDVFSLGAVAWEALAGRRAFDGPTPAEVVLELRRARVPDLRSVVPNVPAGVARIVARALAREPDARPATASEVANELRAGAAEAGLVLGADRVAAWVAAAGVERVAELSARVHTVLTQPEVRTVPEIDLTGAGARDAGEE